jgi:AcrR family transcriptional regulator
MTNNRTTDKIAKAALDLFLSQGIKKTSGDEIAFQAGVTRNTVYRHFGDKQQLVRAAFLYFVSILQGVHQSILDSQTEDIEVYLDIIAREFERFPRGDLPARLDELNHLYPELWHEFHDQRVATMSSIFDRLFALAVRQGVLRDGLNRQVIQAYFMTAVIHVMENPSLIALNLTSADIFSTVKTIFLHGILKGASR